ncbi:MAG: class I SAM-dependent methyltransferase [bacterium]|nr:class I SAM-dependent methyltransferase [bacterium]
MNCKICNSKIKEIFKGRILNKYDAAYFHCENCGFLCTEEPYWLKEAYEDSMNLSDTGILLRNIALSKYASVIIYFLFDKKAKFLDYAGGYGIFTRLMRDIGFDFFWHDPYTKNILAQGFEGTDQEKYELVTSFESFEHFSNPLAELEKLLKTSKSIFFSTGLLINPVPSPDKWWYYGLEHGQHVSFYSLKTLQYIANKYHLNLYSRGNLHLFTAKKINKFLYKFLTMFSNFGLFLFVKNLINSKTFTDMQAIVKKLKK